MNGEPKGPLSKEDVTPPVCHWLRDEDGNDQANCGGAWSLNDGTPPENGMKFCPYCGKSIAWNDYVGPEDDDGE